MELCPSESWAWRWHSCLTCRDPSSAKCAGTQTASAAGVMALSESFFKPLVPGNQETSLVSLSPSLHPFRHLEGSLAWVLLYCLVHQAHRGPPLPPPAGVLFCSLGASITERSTLGGVLQFSVSCIWWASLSLYCSAASAGKWGKRGYGDGSTP